MVKKLLVVLILGVAALVALTSLRGYNGSTGSRLFAPQVSGKIAFVRSGALWLYENGSQRQLTAGPKDRQDKRDGSPAISPDGTEIVYVRYDEGFSDLYKMVLDDPSGTHAITNNRPSAETGSADYVSAALWALFPAWSPSGQHIAYTSDIRTEYPGLFSIDSNGDNSQKLETLDHSQQTVERPSYSPDGKKIAVTNYLTANGKGQIWVLDVADGSWTEITNAPDGAYDAVWSPDGEWLAFTMREGTAHNIYVVPTNAQKWSDKYPTPIKLTGDNASRSPAWSPDGAHLAYISLKNASFDIHVADFDAGSGAASNSNTDGTGTTGTTGATSASSAGNPSLKNDGAITNGDSVDADSGLSWGK